MLQLQFFWVSFQ